MTNAELDAIEARLNAATAGPWQVKYSLLRPGEIRAVGDADGRFIADCETTSRSLDEIAANATFIAHAPADVRALLAEVRRLREERNGWRRRAEDMPHLNER